MPAAIVLMFLVTLIAYTASGKSSSIGLIAALFNLAWWGGLSYLHSRASRKRKMSLEKRGLFVYLRYPGSRPGSLQDIWAGGTAVCQPNQVVFQEVMDGTEVPLGKPTTLDVVGVSAPPRRVSAEKAHRLPPGLMVLTLNLPNSTVEVAAESPTLEKLQQKLFKEAPQPGHMNSITSSFTIRALRDGLADAVARANYGQERVQITKNGKPAAVLIGPEDFELLEQLEMLRDVAEYRAAKSIDDGGCVSLDELRAELDA